jgi:hypothetical protein
MRGSCDESYLPVRGCGEASRRHRGGNRIGCPRTGASVKQRRLEPGGHAFAHVGVWIHPESSRPCNAMAATCSFTPPDSRRRWQLPSTGRSALSGMQCPKLSRLCPASLSLAANDSDARPARLHGPHVVSRLYRERMQPQHVHRRTTTAGVDSTSRLSLAMSRYEFRRPADATRHEAPSRCWRPFER